MAKWPVGPEDGYNAIGSPEGEAGENAKSSEIVFAGKQTGPPFGRDDAEEAARLGSWWRALAFLARVGVCDTVFDGVVYPCKGTKLSFGTLFKSACSLWV